MVIEGTTSHNARIKSEKQMDVAYSPMNCPHRLVVSW